MATKAELRDRAAEMLGLLPIGQTLASQHSTRIEAGYDEVYADLKTRGLNVWASTGDCPDEINPYVAALIALSCTETYPISEARYVRIVNKVGIDGQKGYLKISELVSPEYESTDLPTDF